MRVKRARGTSGAALVALMPLMALALLLGCLGSPALAAVQVVAPQGVLHAQDLLTWHLLGAPSEWLTCESRLAPQLVVVGPDRQTWHRAAFAYRPYRLHPLGPDTTAPEYDPAGPLEMQARHTARLPGLYSWSFISPDGTHLADGQLQVAASALPRGPIGLSPSNRRLLTYADGRPFIPIGPNIAWANAPDRVARFNGYLDHLVAGGGNHCRLWMSSWCGQIEGEQVDHWRLDHAWLLDQLLQLARAHDVHVTLVFDNHYDLVHGTAFPYGDSTRARQDTFISAHLPSGYIHRIEYLLARWGCDDTILAYELFNELDMGQPVREKCVPWARAAITNLQHLDADARLRTVSWAGDDFDRIGDIDGMDLMQVHRYVLEWADPSSTRSPPTRDGIQMLIEPMEVAASIGKAFCFGELGYQSAHDDNPGNTLDHEGLLLRQQAWAGLMLGGYGSGMNWWWDTYIEQDHLWNQYQGLAHAVALVRWNDPDLSPLQPNPAAAKVLVMGWVSPTQGLVWPQPRSDTWYAHLVQGQPRRGLSAPVRVVLTGFTPGATFSIRWLDMITGAQLDRQQALTTADGRLVLLVQPPALDRVAYLSLDAPVKSAP
jgi:hypothetical protein